MRKKIIVFIVCITLTIGVVIVPVLPPQDVSLSEYRDIIDMYHAEISKFDRKELEVRNGDIITALNKKIEENNASEDTKKLMKKAEKASRNTSLLDKINK